MLKDLAVKYNREQHYNCAESLIKAASDYYDLDIDPKSVTLMSGFGNGMMCGDVCGGLIGSIAIISYLYVEQKAAEDKPGLRKKLQKEIRAFEQALGSRLCREIKPKYFSRETGCSITIAKAADILENVITEIEAERQEAEISG